MSFDDSDVQCAVAISEMVHAEDAQEPPGKIGAGWEELGLRGSKKVRDVWRHRELGKTKERVEALVPRHGVELLRLQ